MDPGVANAPEPIFVGSRAGAALGFSLDPIEWLSRMTHGDDGAVMLGTIGAEVGSARLIGKLNPSSR